MSSLSVHISGPNRRGFGDYLKLTYQANSPISTVFALNSNVWFDIQANSPSTILIYRDDRYGSDPFSDAFFAGTVAQAQIIGYNWISTYAPIWALNKANYYAFVNEPGLHSADGYDRYNAFCIGAMTKANESGLKLALYDWSTGTPDLTLLSHLVPSLIMAKTNGHLLALHEYSLEGGMIVDPPNPLVLRYRELRKLLPIEAQCNFVITEAGPGAGYGASLTMQSYIDDVAKYDKEVMKDSYVKGVDLFDLGNSESNMQNVLPLLTTYTINNPTPPSIVESPNNTIIPPTLQIVDNLLHIWTLGAPAVHGSVILRDNIQYLGGQGTLLFYYNKKIYAKNDLNEWYVTKPESATSNWIKTSDPRISESINDTTIPTSDKIIDSELNIWTLGTPSSHGYLLLKNGGQWAGGQGVLLLYHDHKVYTKNDLNMWFVATESMWQLTIDPCLGMDISLYQKSVTWPLITANFVFIKATESNNITDPYFKINWTNCNIPKGAYHFYRFGITPQSQAKLFIDTLSGNYGELPLVVDVEDTKTTPNLNDLKIFIDIIQNTTKRRVMVYTGAWWFAKYNLTAPTWLSALDLWVADYSSNWIPILPKGWITYKFRQYTSSGTMTGIIGNVDLDTFNGINLQDYIKTVPYISPTSSVIKGLQMRADGESTTMDFLALSTAKLNSAKIMTNTSFEEFATLRTLVPVKNIVLRLFAAGDNPSLGNPTIFFNEQKAWLSEFSYRGGIYVEIHNEPNLPQEGYGTFWSNATKFGAFYSKIADLIHSNYPTLKVGWPGLSPNTANENDFITVLKQLILQGKVDWIAAHSYWINSADMDNLDNGRHYRRFLNLGKPVIISEFANIQTNDSDIVKGQQYKSFFTSLENGVVGAYAFVSSASDSDFNFSRQTWVRNNALTDIPKQF